MNALGIDYGEKRVGLAFGDDIGVASPLKAATQSSGEERLNYIGELICQRKIDRLVVGYPYNMDGTIGFKAKEVDVFITVLEKRFGLPIFRVDETLTSYEAEEAMKKPKKPKRGLPEARKHRATGEIDSRAAAIILQDHLDTMLGIPTPDEDLFDEDFPEDD